MKEIRKHFPLLNKITYLDNAALLQKPLSVIEASNDFYLNYAVSTRTSDSVIGIQNAKKIEQVRQKCANLFDAQKDDQIIFTSGTTDSLNKIALMLEKFINQDSEIIIQKLNHSSNTAPWVMLAKKHNAKVVFSDDIISDINDKTKIIALTQVTNNLQIKVDLDKIYEAAHKHNIIVINDAAQAVISQKVSLKNCDVIAMSANKLYGPMGFGVLAIKSHLAKQLQPVFYGGGSIKDVNQNACDIVLNPNNLYEPGTPNIAAFYMFDKALDFFNSYTYDEINWQLDKLSNYAINKLSTIENIEIYNTQNDHIILFNIKGVNSQDVAHYLGTKDIYVRAGLFCAYGSKYEYNVASYVRVSLAIYNNYEDIDKLVDALQNGGDFLVL